MGVLASASRPVNSRLNRFLGKSEDEGLNLKLYK